MVPAISRREDGRYDEVMRGNDWVAIQLFALTRIYVRSKHGYAAFKYELSASAAERSVFRKG